MKIIIFLLCIFTLVPILPNNAFPQSFLLARQILIEKYNYFNETTQTKELFQAIEESFSGNWGKKEIRLISNISFINACNFALIRNLSSTLAARTRPQLGPLDFKLSIMKYDTLLTRPCKTPKRILEQKKLVYDFLLFTSDAEKFTPLMEAQKYKMEDLVKAKNFFTVYQSSLKISKGVPQYGFVNQLYEGNFVKLETLLHYLRLNFVFDIGDNDILKNFGQLNEILQIKFNR